MTPLETIACYFVLTIVAALCAWRSDDVALRQIAAWMVIEWIGSNAIFHGVGAVGAPWLTPSFDAVICVMVAGVAVVHRCGAAWEVVRLFVLEEIIVVGSFLTHQEGTPFYYLALNAVFVCQLWAFGGQAFVELVGRLGRGGERLGRRASSSA